jgi:hypothetical protein
LEVELHLGKATAIEKGLYVQENINFTIKD